MYGAGQNVPECFDFHLRGLKSSILSGKPATRPPFLSFNDSDAELKKKKKESFIF